jgi:fructokinase
VLDRKPGYEPTRAFREHPPHITVGLGEFLWDLFPGGKQLGGAPSNFAYITSLLGDSGIIASRLGTDNLGYEAVRTLQQFGLTDSYVQRDREHSTGTVRVQIDCNGQPQFEITHPVAWDFLEWTPQWQALAAQTDAVCFGSLAQRSAQSRSTIRSFLSAISAHALRVFDVNLRQSFYSAEVISDAIGMAQVVKLNHEELPRIMLLMALPYDDELSSARRLRSHFGLKLVCITRGAQGSLLCSEDDIHEHPGLQVEVKDTVGAGDAFTAGLVYSYLRHASLEVMNEVANRMGAWVSSQAGATPPAKTAPLQAVRAALGSISGLPRR